MNGHVRSGGSNLKRAPAGEERIIRWGRMTTGIPEATASEAAVGLLEKLKIARREQTRLC